MELTSSASGAWLAAALALAAVAIVLGVAWRRTRARLQREITARERLEGAGVAELDALRRLQQTGTQLAYDGELHKALEEIVESAIVVAAADFADLQLVDAITGEPRIAAQRGLPQWWLDFWNEAAKGQGAYGKALARGERVVVEDVSADAIFRDHPAALEAQARAGIRALQATPFTGRAGKTIGLLSTHYRTQHRPDARTLALLDVLAGQAAQIIERAELERALRESEERFRTLADNMSQLAWMADASGWRVWHNKRWYEYAGGSFVEMQGWGWQKALHPEHAERVVARLQQAMDSGAPWEDTFALRAADGSYRWFLSRALPIRDAQGRITRWFGTETDITERRMLEEELQAVDRRKDEFLAMLGHELRNPLGPIRNAVQLLGLVDAKDPAALKARQMIERQSAHMARLIDDLLDVARIRHGKLQIRKSRCDLASLVRDVVEDNRQAAAAQDLTLTADISAEPLWLDGDETRLSQIAGNLLHNAIKFTEPGGRVEVRLRRAGAHAELTVRDSGIGMDADTLAQLFGAFNQADRSLDRTRGGLGLGLALVKHLVELHAGTVQAKSDGPGRGSELTVRLPLRVAADTVRTVPVDEPDRTRAQRVLVIEDNIDAAESLCMLLQTMGHVTEMAHSGTAGVAAAKRFQPDIVFCDIGLPAMDGYAVARALRADPRLAGIYLIALTGYGAPEDLRRTREAGFELHLVKPVDYAALAMALAFNVARGA